MIAWSPKKTNSSNHYDIICNQINPGYHLGVESNGSSQETEKNKS